MVSLVVKIEEGQVKGKIDEDYLGNKYYSFLGIPYAKAPVGQLRFKAPVPAEPWEGTYDATQQGPECPSFHMLFHNYVGSEDNCLNLNVYTPKLPEENDFGTLKPVMVWIHGGGFLSGSNRREMYGPDYLITEDIVMVAINYRIGVLGFLSLEDPTLEVPGNAGMKDMILALKWVQKNIKKFGGDPNNVTIFGESAGSASVHYLYLSPLSKGLFHKVIAQSGCALNWWARGCSNGHQIAKHLGFQDTDERQILEHLTSESAYNILKAQQKEPEPYTASKIRPFGPVIEKNKTATAFLTEDPFDIIKAGKFNQVPIIMGFTSREGILFESLKIMQEGKSTSDLEDEIYFSLNIKKGSEKSKKIASAIKKFYFDDKEHFDLDKINMLKTDNMFVHGIYQSISYQKLTSQAPIYVYQMTIETSLNIIKHLSTSNHVLILGFLYYLVAKFGNGWFGSQCLKLARSISRKPLPGVCHADDLFYLFKTHLSGTLEVGSAEETHIKKFVKLWTNFAKSGNPTPDKNDQLLNVDWKPVTKEENLYLEIGEELLLKSNPDDERMKFWDNICDDKYLN